MLIYMKNFIVDKHKYNFIGGFFGLGLFVTLALILTYGNLSPFDLGIYHMVAKGISKPMTEVMLVISYLGDAPFSKMFIIGWLIFSLINRKYLPYWSFIVINLAGSSTIKSLLKNHFQRERPDILRLQEIGGFSFPSGHSINSMVLYGLLIFIIIKEVKLVKLKYIGVFICGLMIFLVGLSRIYLGVHYPSDVLAGFAVGFSWLSFFLIWVEERPITNYIIRRMKEKSRLAKG